MEKFHITITNNETAETLVDRDTSVIVGAMDEGEGTRTVCFTCCGATELAAVLASVMQVANMKMADLPKPYRRITKKLGKQKFNEN